MKLGRAALEEKPTLVVIDASRELYWRASEVFPGYHLKDSDNMVTLIQSGCDLNTPLPTKGGHPLKMDLLLPPLPNPPRNIMCVGKNYVSHAEEFSKSGFDASSAAETAIPEHPIIFTKPRTSISGPFDDIPMWAGLDGAIDYEAELGVVIGKAGRFVSREEALDHIFGFVVLNDVTARDLQKEHKQWYLGKGIDGFCPMGPWISTRADVHLATAKIESKVNGELRQQSTLAQMIFDIPCLIETISRSMALCVGDIIATGTPEGVGIGFNPPKFLRNGDVVECTVEGIGSIVNRVKSRLLEQEEDLALQQSNTR
jgi:2-keto-4-pentenoate hydratase/2-oxohepta-3-ene-1,7-dioic acid hydratase in catechol pathway